MAVTIRAATPEDAGVLASLLTQLGYPSTEPDVLARLSYWTADANSRVLVAERDGRPVGCLSVHAVPYFEHTALGTDRKPGGRRGPALHRRR